MSFGEHVMLLNDGNQLPLLGLGTYQITDDTDVKHAIYNAFSSGYRLIDTASFYRNEAGIGKTIKSLGIPREDLFITTKVWNTAQRIDDIEESFQRSLERLGLDYLDLYLIHWPVHGCYLNTWKTMERLHEKGLIKSIGVSNFSIHDLQILESSSNIPPAVDQIEFHPLFNNPKTLAYCKEHHIAMQAYSPLARGGYLNSPLMIEIGNRHNKTPAQVGLRWLIQQGICVIPKSCQKDHIKENSQLFNFILSEEEMAAITAMDLQQRVSGIPEDMVPYIAK